MPVYNEAETLPRVLAELPWQRFRQVLVVDNGSTDGSGELARAAGATVVSEPRRGYGQACLAGLAALAPEIAAVVFMDADGADDPADLDRLLEPLRQGRVDVVIGSRILGRHEAGALTLPQRFGNVLACHLMRWLYGTRYTDLGPFRAVTRAALNRLAMRDRNFGWTVEMQVKAARLKLRVQEVPVHYRKRAGGRSKISGTLQGVIQAGYVILRSVLMYGSIGSRTAIDSPPPDSLRESKRRGLIRTDKLRRLSAP